MVNKAKLPRKEKMRKLWRSYCMSKESRYFVPFVLENEKKHKNQNK